MASTQELRKQVREHYSNADGTWLANASKSECEKVLDGSLTVNQAAANYYASKLGSLGAGGDDGEQTDQVELAEGDSEKIAVIEDIGDNTIIEAARPVVQGISGFVDPSKAKALTDLVNLAGTVTAELKQKDREFDDLRKQLADANQRASAAASHKPSEFERDANAGTVKIPGFGDHEVIGTKDANGNPHPEIPDMKAHKAIEGFDPRLVRFHVTAGASNVRMDFGDMLQIIRSGENVLLVGPPGTSKTSQCLYLGAALQWPVVVFQCSKDRSLMEFVGCWTAENGQTIWVDGPLTKAMRDGCLLVVDEVDHAPAECTSILHDVLNSGHLMLAEKGGEVVRAHPNFRIVGTANTAGHGDTTGVHTAAKVQDSAFMSRWGVKLRTTYLTMAKERDLISSRFGMAPDKAELIAKVAADSRATPELTQPLGLRQTQAWARVSMLLGGTEDAIAKAFGATILVGIPEDEAEVVAEIAQRHFGSVFGEKDGDSDE